MHQRSNGRELEGAFCSRAMLIWLFGAIFLSIMSGTGASRSHARCNPELSGRLPPQVQKICEALDKIWMVQDGLESLSKASGASMSADLLGSQIDGEKKAEDKEHVFLRFGRSGMKRSSYPF